MYDLLLPPDITLDTKVLKTSPYKQYDCTSIIQNGVPTLLDFFENTQFNPTCDLAKAYFKCMNIEPYHESSCDWDCKKLLQDYEPQLKDMYYRNMFKKLGLLTHAIKHTIVTHSIEPKYSCVLRRLVDNGVQWERPGWNSIIRTILLDTNMLVSQRENDQFDWRDRLDSEEDTKDLLEVVYESEIKNLLTTIMDICYSKATAKHMLTTGEDFVSGIIMVLTVASKCLYPKYWKKTLTLKDYHFAEKELILKTDDTHNEVLALSPHEYRKTTEDIDPSVIMMIDNYFKCLCCYNNIEDRLAKKGYRMALLWAVVERYILGYEVNALPCDKGESVATEDEPPEPRRVR